MTKKQEDVKKAAEPVVEEPVEQEPHVFEHLDRDLNDPRNRPEAKALPSLDD